MIRNTFCHIPGIGIRTERLFWNRGMHSWDDFDQVAATRLPMGHKRRRTLAEHLDLSRIRLGQHDPHYFADLLPPDQHWRLFADFREQVAYLDIETTGMGSPFDVITTLALFDGKTVRWYVQGHNLEEFKADLQNYQVVVTYNGKCFDLPFIRSTLNLRMDQVHIDLRYLLASLGYRGGLKGCERQLGIGRNELDGVDGFFAVLLWDEYRRHHNRQALETLLAYNILDAINLETLMVLAYNRKTAETPFTESHRLNLPAVPRLPFAPDEATIERIRTRLDEMGCRRDSRR